MVHWAFTRYHHSLEAFFVASSRTIHPPQYFCLWLDNFVMRGELRNSACMVMLQHAPVLGWCRPARTLLAELHSVLGVELQANCQNDTEFTANVLTLTLPRWRRRPKQWTARLFPSRQCSQNRRTSSIMRVIGGDLFAQCSKTPCANVPRSG